MPTPTAALTDLVGQRLAVRLQVALDDAVNESAGAAVGWLASVRPDLADDLGLLDDTLPADVLEGTLLMGARLYARRGTPVGAQPGVEGGGGGLLRVDPDVERLVGIGRHRHPRGLIA
ncbi:hypothetical protein [Jannaschia sp. R86511]|uniref:hypothetical protein n=1 Tax=Jannaschia sp. R86511 TaxID=3093853 RepID=UPI0036D2E702